MPFRARKLKFSITLLFIYLNRQNLDFGFFSRKRLIVSMHISKLPLFIIADP